MNSRETYIEYAKNNQPYTCNDFGSYGYPSGESKYDILKLEWVILYTELIDSLQVGNVEEAIKLEKHLTTWIAESPITVHLKIAIHSVLRYIWHNRLEKTYEEYCTQHRDSFAYIVKWNQRPSLKQELRIRKVKQTSRQSSYSKQFHKG